jgi:hypothetical protein
MDKLGKLNLEDNSEIIDHPEVLIIRSLAPTKSKDGLLKSGQNTLRNGYE